MSRYIFCFQCVTHARRVRQLLRMMAVLLKLAGASLQIVTHEHGHYSSSLLRISCITLEELKRCMVNSSVRKYLPHPEQKELVKVENLIDLSVET